jgi:predicted transcriptional regulator
MTQTAVARMLGVSRAAVRNWIDPAEAERRRVANRRRRAAR